MAHEQPENDPEKEPSAFRQVHAEYPAYQPVSTLCFPRHDSYESQSSFRFPVISSLNNYLLKQETIRDDNFNTFWSKIPPPQQELSWEGVRPRCGSSCSSEDSRSLDVTGSEDECGGGGALDG